MKDTETRIADMEKTLQDLLRHVASGPPPADFTEYHGALFKKVGTDEYVEAVYCPLCILPAGAMGQGHYLCQRCRIEVDIGVGELRSIIHNQVKHVGKHRSITGRSS